MNLEIYDIIKKFTIFYTIYNLSNYKEVVKMRCQEYYNLNNKNNRIFFILILILNSQMQNPDFELSIKKFQHHYDS